MKPTSKTKATLFIISKLNMIAGTNISSRSVSTLFKAIRTLVLVILFSAGVVADTKADRHGVTGLHVVPSPFISNSSLDAAAVIADNDIWAVGLIGAGSGPFQTLAEHFDGTSWSVVSTPSGNAAFFGVAGAASNDVWAVGSVNPFMLSSENTLIEHWDGTSWSVVSSPAFSGVSGPTGVSADSSTDVWAIGDLTGGGTTSLHWNGQTWSQIPTAPLRFGGVSAVAALSPTNVWAVGTGPGAPHPAGVIEHWDGTSWSVVPSPNPFPNVNTLDAVAAASANDIDAFGDSPLGPFSEHWNGTQWSIINTPSGVARMIGATAISDGTVVAVGQGTNGSAVILHN